jgi:hypothetical protein
MINPKRVSGWAALMLLVATALVSSGCYVEQRKDGSWWACGTVQTAHGPVSGCQPIDVAVVK